MQYIATGNFVIDDVIKDGEHHNNPCGPVGYAYGGLRLYTDDCKMVANVGRDFPDRIKDYDRYKGIPLDGFNIKTDFTNEIKLRFLDENAYEYNYALGDWLGAINFGMLRIQPEEIARHLKGVKGLYIDQPIETTFWQKMDVYRKEYNFKIMWEVQYETGKELFFADCKEQRAKQLVSLLPHVDMFTMNLSECAELFQTESDEESLKKAKTFTTPMFLRAGSKGAYWVENGEAFFVPSLTIDGYVVDTMGCGNCASAAALWARTEGYDPYSIVILANIAAAYSLRQYGPIPAALVTPELRKEAMELARRLRSGYGTSANA